MSFSFARCEQEAQERSAIETVTLCLRDHFVTQQHLCLGHGEVHIHTEATCRGK